MAPVTASASASATGWPDGLQSHHCKGSSASLAHSPPTLSVSGSSCHSPDNQGQALLHERSPWPVSAHVASPHRSSRPRPALPWPSSSSPGGPRGRRVAQWPPGPARARLHPFPWPGLCDLSLSWAPAQEGTAHTMAANAGHPGHEQGGEGGNHTGTQRMMEGHRERTSPASPEPTHVILSFLLLHSLPELGGLLLKTQYLRLQLHKPEREREVNARPCIRAASAGGASSSWGDTTPHLWGCPWPSPTLARHQACLPTAVLGRRPRGFIRLHHWKQG